MCVYIPVRFKVDEDWVEPNDFRGESIWFGCVLSA